jgi:hypothetical protein
VQLHREHLSRGFRASEPEQCHSLFSKESTEVQNPSSREHEDTHNEECMTQWLDKYEDRKNQPSDNQESSRHCHETPATYDEQSE